MEHREHNGTFRQGLVYALPATMPWGMHPLPCPCLDKGQESQSKPYHVKASYTLPVVHIQCSVCYYQVKAEVRRPSFVWHLGNSMLNLHYWLPFPCPLPTMYADLERISMMPSMLVK
jgi:hypothetical protein